MRTHNLYSSCRKIPAGNELPCLQSIEIQLYPEPDESSSHTHALSVVSILYQCLIYAWVSQVSSFLEVLRLQFYYDLTSLSSCYMSWLSWPSVMMYTAMSSESHKGRDHFVDLGVDGRIILKWILEKSVRVCNGLTWLRIRSNGTSSGFQTAVNFVTE
jgi:hypothetical protein